MHSPEINEDVFRAVADPTRRKLLELLHHADRSVLDLARPFRMTRPAISQHLRILRKAGLVRAKRMGRRQVYRLNAKPLDQMSDWVKKCKTFVAPGGQVWSIAQRTPPSKKVQSKPSNWKGAIMAIRGASAAVGRITPHLLVKDVDEAVAFYEKAFAAVELYRSALPHIKGFHVHMRLADNLIMLTTEDPSATAGELTLAAPQTIGGSSVVLELLVDDCDAWFKRAVDAGGKPSLEPTDMFWGDRYSWVIDPFGHIWGIAAQKEMISPEEVRRRMHEMMAEMNG